MTLLHVRTRASSFTHTRGCMYVCMHASMYACNCDHGMINTNCDEEYICCSTPFGLDSILTTLFRKKESHS